MRSGLPTGHWEVGPEAPVVPPSGSQYAVGEHGDTRRLRGEGTACLFGGRAWVIVGEAVVEGRIPAACIGRCVRRAWVAMDRAGILCMEKGRKG